MGLGTGPPHGLPGPRGGGDRFGRGGRGVPGCRRGGLRDLVAASHGQRSGVGGRQAPRGQLRRGGEHPGRRTAGGPDAVRAAVSMVENGFEAGTCATAVRDAEECRDPSVVKVVLTTGGRALYFSRAAIPYGHDGTGGQRPWRPGRHLRHVGIYAYGPEALGRWVGFKRSALEVEEGLEQLRALENGMRIGVAVVAEAAAGVTRHGTWPGWNGACGPWDMDPAASGPPSGTKRRV